jgi:sulfur carrier protein
VVNRERLVVRANTLDALSAELDFLPDLVATAVNENFVRAKERASTPLDENDRVEILTPRQGADRGG